MSKADGTSGSAGLRRRGRSQATLRIVVPIGVVALVAVVVIVGVTGGSKTAHSHVTSAAAKPTAPTTSTTGPPVCIAGASKPSHLDDAVASLEIVLTSDELTALEAPYTPRGDFQGVSDDSELGRISARLGIKPAGS
jgi:hypothetical protein